MRSEKVIVGCCIDAARKALARATPADDGGAPSMREIETTLPAASTTAIAPASFSSPASCTPRSIIARASARVSSPLLVFGTVAVMRRSFYGVTPSRIVGAAYIRARTLSIRGGRASERPRAAAPAAGVGDARRAFRPGRLVLAGALASQLADDAILAAG